MSSEDMASLHDLYEAVDADEECHKTAYILQFVWRGMTSNYDVLGPYFTLSGTVEAQQLHSIVIKTLLVFNQFNFRVRGFLCDGASSNLALIKQLCAHKKGEKISSNFFSPFDGKKIHIIICPSHQVSHVTYIIYR